MGDHDLPESAEGTSRLVEVKVVVASLVTLLTSVAVALLNAVQDSPGLLGGWPPWVQFVVLTVIPPVLAFLAGYRQPSNRV